MSKDKKRCIQCGKLLIGESKMGLCPKCADKDARGAVEGAAGLAVIALILGKTVKPALKVAKTVTKAIFRI